MIFCEVSPIKLLTLNTHSLIEENYDQKLIDFVDAVSRQQPDVIALQEVNQSCTEEMAAADQLMGFCPCNTDTIIRKDNHAFWVVKLLREKGISYDWTWLGLKKGYDKYDEGIALLSRSRILETDVVQISDVDDYQNWKTRKIVGIRMESKPDTWFYSVHTSWWNDPEEPLQKQWQRMQQHMKMREKVWLLGDFNSPAEVTGEGYEMIQNAGWKDSYILAAQKDSGITVGKVIDGWRDKLTDTDGMRIDQIWCNHEPVIQSSKVIFNGINEPVVSDHYGILVEI